MISDSNSSNQATNIRTSTEHQVFIALGGITLPIIALLVELFSNLCSATFFNPIPTVWHILLIALVPIGIFIINWSLRYRRFDNSLVLTWLNGALIGISALYTIRFLPLTVFALG